MRKHDPFILGGKLPSERANPLSVAKHYLNLIHRSPRLVEKNGAYWLDGTPVNLNDIMQETNRLRLYDNKPQIDSNPAWLVPEVIPMQP